MLSDMRQACTWREEQRAQATNRWLERIRALRLKLVRLHPAQLDWQQFVEGALIEICGQETELIGCVLLSTGVLADIVCWYSKREEYLGYVLYSSTCGSTVLFDCIYAQYVVIGEGAARELVVCTDSGTAKRFVDVLHRICADSGR